MILRRGKILFGLVCLCFTLCGVLGGVTRQKQTLKELHTDHLKTLTTRSADDTQNSAAGNASRRQFAVENLEPFPGPVSHVIEKPVVQHHVHYVPKPYPVMSVHYVPKPVPVPIPISPSYHVSRVPIRHGYHLNPCQDGGIYVSMAHGYFCICPKDYRGKDCQERNYCSSMPCLNGGSCVEIPGAFKCGCPFGFLGTVCEERDACHPNPCKNGGTCTRSDTESGFVCVCKEGFTGEHCEGFNRCDPNPCKNGATCQQIKDDKYECLCPPPYKGTLCADTRQCFVNPCMNGGTCHESETGYECSCRHGYTNANCEVHVCHPNPCHHGGRCEVESGHFKCVCPPLYKGYQCEIPHPCFTRPCQNNGVCIDSYSGFSAYPDNWDSHGYLHYLCLCQQGFMGPNCEMDICKRCDPNAKCLNNTCVCIEGYFGDGFSCKRVPHPCHPNPCKNNGVCAELQGGEYDCKCPEGTTGKHCEIKDACLPNPCQNGGKCVEAQDGTTRCICENSYTGANCELPIDPCTSNPCQNGGTCMNDKGKAVCRCKGKWTGVTCRECSCPKGNKAAVPPEMGQVCDAEGECRCDGSMTKTETGCKEGRTSTPCSSSPCKNGGTCTDTGPTTYACSCPLGFTGTNCEKPVCTPDYCKNNGICQPRVDGPSCLCQPGFSGPRCENKSPTKVKDPCHPNPCLNGGSCKPVSGSYDCHCDARYTGAHCEIDKCAKCHVQAVCIHGHCKCRAGYIGTGYECMKAHTTRVCPTTCPIYSTCSPHGSCQCIPGYTMTGNYCSPPEGSNPQSSKSPPQPAAAYHAIPSPPPYPYTGDSADSRRAYRPRHQPPAPLSLPTAAIYHVIPSAAFARPAPPSPPQAYMDVLTASPQNYGMYPYYKRSYIGMKKKENERERKRMR
ncbi:neurogenic locus notch homolog protein 1 isoform X2 [Nematostella vectensis]|uniref:neurogenic locus notch homolog protein 1 isoform X2 n=1 Tax=Nematostella vectensis TaxID=45351 RepID=UPI002076F948|nr:neurogenic locus notch homolog protein 1 isoform X2 [Nematostella vectensis]